MAKIKVYQAKKKLLSFDGLKALGPLSLRALEKTGYIFTPLLQHPIRKPAIIFKLNKAYI